MLDLDVRRRVIGVGGHRRVMTLAHEHRGQARAQQPLHGGEQVGLVVDRHIVRGRIALLYRIEHVLLVYVDQHLAGDRLPQPAVFDLVRLEHDVAVGQDRRGAQRAQVGEGVQRVRVQMLGEGIVQQPGADAQHARMGFPTLAKTLQRAEVVGVANRRAQRLVNVEIALPTFVTE